jgi:hypothetical protein
MVGGRLIRSPRPVPRVSFTTVRQAIAALTSARVVCTVVPLLLGWLVWSVYRPGIMNVDGIWIYAQALRHTFEDWQPVYIAIGLSWLVPLGVKLAHITLAESLLTCLGIQRLAAHTVRRLAAVSDRTAHRIGLVTLLLLLLPVTPLAYYLTYFGSDGLLAVVLLWYAVFWLVSHERFPSAGPRERVLRAGGLTALAGLAILMRPNAVVLLPIFAGLLFALYGRTRWQAALIWCVLLVAIRPTASAVVYSCYDIDRVHPEDQVMALDLIGLAIMRPDALAHLPLTSASLDGDRYKREYVWGVVDPLYPWGHEPIVKPGFARDGHEAITAEYRQAWRKFPGTLALVKLRAFLAYLLEPQPYWHNVGIDPNDLGLFHTPKRQPVRDLHAAADHLVYVNPVLQWISARHVLWLGLNVAAVAALAYMLRRRASRAATGVLLMLLVPLGYYLSFALAITTNSYRFMYPSTLIVQAVLVALAVNALRCWLARAAERLPD